MKLYVYYAGHYDDGEHIDVPDLARLLLLIGEFDSPAYLIPPKWTDAGHWQLEVINVIEV